MSMTTDEALREAEQFLRKEIGYMSEPHAAAVEIVLASLGAARKPNLHWWPSDADYSTEDIEETLDNAGFDKGIHVVEVDCAKRLPPEFYIWDTDYEREEPNKLSGPFATRAEAQSAIDRAATCAEGEAK